MVNKSYSFLFLLISLFCSLALAEPFTLTVVNGSGSGTYESSSLVYIFANPHENPDAASREPPTVDAPVRIFDRWIGDTSGVADVFSPDTTLVMPQATITITAQYQDTPRWTPPAVWSYFPPDYDKVIFLFHGGGSYAANVVTNSEISRFIDAAAARGYGVVALDSYKRSIDNILETWDSALSVADNLDMQRVAALRNELIDQGTMRATDPLYLFGVSGGGMFASLFSQQEVQNELDFTVKATALMVSPGYSQVMVSTSSTVPTIFLLAQNDTAIPNAQAVENFNFLVSRGIPSQLWINSPSPVYPERFWRINHLSRTDSENIYNALKTGGYLDENDFLLNNPAYSDWRIVIPSQYAGYLEGISDQLWVAYAEHMAISSFSGKILDFFEDPQTVIPLPPAVSSFTPTSGLPGTGVTIAGSGFINVTSVSFNGTAANFQPISTTKLLAFVPLGATTGPVKVTSVVGSTTSATDFTVLEPPIISSFTPTKGPVGTQVTITGSHLIKTTAVDFSGVAANFTVISDNQIMATVSKGTARFSRIKVTTPAGTVTAPGFYTTTY